MCTWFSASWRRFRYDTKCLFSCIYNPRITISPTSLFSVNFNGNRVKNHPQPWTCPLTTVNRRRGLHWPSWDCVGFTAVDMHTVCEDSYFLTTVNWRWGLLRPSWYCVGFTAVDMQSLWGLIHVNYCELMLGSSLTHLGLCRVYSGGHTRLWGLLRFKGKVQGF